MNLHTSQMVSQPFISSLKLATTGPFFGMYIKHTVVLPVIETKNINGILWLSFGAATAIFGN